MLTEDDKLCIWARCSLCINESIPCLSYVLNVKTGGRKSQVSYTYDTISLAPVTASGTSSAVSAVPLAGGASNTDHQHVPDLPTLDETYVVSYTA